MCITYSSSFTRKHTYYYDNRKSKVGKSRNASILFPQSTVLRYQNGRTFSYDADSLYYVAIELKRNVTFEL